MHHENQLQHVPVREVGEAFASSNLALCKYWGKRDAALNLPLASSLSISLGRLGTRARIQPSAANDHLIINGAAMPAHSEALQRLVGFLNTILGDARPKLHIKTYNTIPTQAGLASSASAYAAITRALNHLFGWGFDARTLSTIARIGSGSASRSLFEGFVVFHAGRLASGVDAYAEPLDIPWPEFRIGVVVVNAKAKGATSREAMNRTFTTSPLTQGWAAFSEASVERMTACIRNQNFIGLGEIAEHNAMNMHALMLSSWPSAFYWQPETLTVIQRAHQLRAGGVPVFCTLDAGPNVKLLFLQEHEPTIREHFSSAQIIAPFTQAPA